MGMLSFARNERLILIGLGVAATGLVACVHHLLTQYRDTARIESNHPKPQYITQDTEDSLALGTLDTLLGHYNLSIRETADRIICDRAANDESVVHLLLWGITRPDYEERITHLRALGMIIDNHNCSVLNNPKAYSAFVRSLELGLADAHYEKLDGRLYDEYPLRDRAERTNLVFIKQLIDKYGVRDVIKARFIERWLSMQRWGDGEEERQRNFIMFMRLRDSNVNKVKEICDRLLDSITGRERIEQIGLLPEFSEERGLPYEDRICPFPSTVEGQRIGEDGEVVSATRLGDGVLHPRNMEQSEEEQRLRRQHREAMVLNDGSRPFGRDDIIEREQE